MFLLLLTSLYGMAQTRTVTGTVTGQDDGQPLAGVSVKIKNGAGGAVTRSYGKYSLSAGSKDILVFSSIGYTAVEFVVGDKAVINVRLTSESQSLEEVTIQVPYGTAKKSAFTGSETTATSSTLARQQVTSFSRALEGLVPGIVATSGGGQPGSNASLLVRGVGFVNASAAPLYVLDGAPYNGDISSLELQQ